MTVTRLQPIMNKFRSPLITSVLSQYRMAFRETVQPSISRYRCSYTDLESKGITTQREAMITRYGQHSAVKMRFYGTV